MRLTVKLFARARDLAGSDRVEIELPDGARVGDLRRALQEQFPPLAALAGTLLVAVNNDYAADDAALTPQNEVACFPPVSGG